MAELTARIGLDSSQFSAGLAQAEAQTNGFGTKISQAGDMMDEHFGHLSRGLGRLVSGQSREIQMLISGLDEAVSTAAGSWSKFTTAFATTGLMVGATAAISLGLKDIREQVDKFNVHLDAMGYKSKNALQMVLYTMGLGSLEKDPDKLAKIAKIEADLDTRRIIGNLKEPSWEEMVERKATAMGPDWVRTHPDELKEYADEQKSFFEESKNIEGEKKPAGEKSPEAIARERLMELQSENAFKDLDEWGQSKELRSRIGFKDLRAAGLEKAGDTLGALTAREDLERLRGRYNELYRQGFTGMYSGLGDRPKDRYQAESEATLSSAANKIADAIANRGIRIINLPGAIAE